MEGRPISGFPAPGLKIRRDVAERWLSLVESARLEIE